MPPTSNIRKSSILTTISNRDDTTTRRTTSGRAVRQNTNRPSNYYARPFGSFTAASPQDAAPQEQGEHGFFPAIQFFTDAITALPKEVMRQFTLMKEVEAKIHGPNERLGEVVDKLMEYPVPPRKSAEAATGANTNAAAGAGLLSFTASNSVAGSANVSLINGVAPNQGGHSARPSIAGSSTGEESTQDNGDELARRQQYHELRFLTHNLLANLDEKNVVLAEANRVLSLQSSRIDSVLPHLENEVSEEARLGSMTHWAYSDNRVKKTATTANERQRGRDVAATNALASAASAVHENEIAQARKDAGREATREKAGKGRREQVDSEFEDKPRKTQAKSAKAKAAPAGLGISTNGEPVKKRKLDKSAAPPMERSVSNMSKAGKAMRETPRSTPAAEASVKSKAKAKPPPPPKRKAMASAQNSPALASSPLHSSFNVATAMEPPPSARPQSARLRQNSTSTNLRHERIIDPERAATAAKANGNGNSKSNGKKRAREDAAEPVSMADTEEKDKVAGDMKQETAGSPIPAPPSRSGSSNKNKSGRASQAGTPRNESFGADAAMVRTRSTRSLRGARGESRDNSSSEPQVQGVGSKHRRNGGGSLSGLIKQLAPYNKSPDYDRHKGRDDMDEDLDSLDGDDRDIRTAQEHANPDEQSTLR